MNTIKASQPFAADVIEYARPMLFQIAATVIMQFCKEHLFDGDFYESKRYFKKCTRILYESLQLSTETARVKSLTKSDLRMMFDTFEKSKLIKNGHAKVTRQQIVALLDALMANETESLPAQALCPANPIADTICSVGVELMQSCQDLGKIAVKGSVNRVASRLTRKSVSVAKRFEIIRTVFKLEEE